MPHQLYAQERVVVFRAWTCGLLKVGRGRGVDLNPLIIIAAIIRILLTACFGSNDPPSLPCSPSSFRSLFSIDSSVIRAPFLSQFIARSLFLSCLCLFSLLPSFFLPFIPRPTNPRPQQPFNFLQTFSRTLSALIACSSLPHSPWVQPIHNHHSRLPVTLPTPLPRLSSRMSPISDSGLHSTGSPLPSLSACPRPVSFGLKCTGLV